MKITDSMYENAVMAELSTRVKDYRINMDLTREELADKAFISLGTLKRFENGHEISLSNFIKILHALGLSANFDLLITDQAERPSVIMQGKKKQRARKKNNEVSMWEWGDDD